jgi:hypothetical protein
MLQAHVQRAEMCPAQVRLMRAALDRIASGSYGHCAWCYGEIGMVRLKALPHAVFCIPCREDTFRHRDSGNVGIRRFIEEGGNNVCYSLNGIQPCRGQLAGVTPDRKTTPKTSAETARKETFHRAIGYLVHGFLFGVRNW